MAVRDFRAKTPNSIPVSIITIVPDDNQDLTPYSAGLRIWNPNATAATIKIDTVGGDTVTLTIPPTTLTQENIYVAKVYATGTTGTLVIHGFIRMGI